MQSFSGTSNMIDSVTCIYDEPINVSFVESTINHSNMKYNQRKGSNNSTDSQQKHRWLKEINNMLHIKSLSKACWLHNVPPLSVYTVIFHPFGSHTETVFW